VCKFIRGQISSQKKDKKTNLIFKKLFLGPERNFMGFENKHKAFLEENNQLKSYTKILVGARICTRIRTGSKLDLDPY
jgi:hypothetical protein